MSSKESENSAALRVLNLRKTYKAAAAPALDGVTFEVGQGEFFGLLGPNGAGKSTTLKMICGMLRPTASSNPMREALTYSAATRSKNRALPKWQWASCRRKSRSIRFSP